MSLFCSVEPVRPRPPNLCECSHPHRIYSGASLTHPMVGEVIDAKPNWLALASCRCLPETELEQIVKSTR